MAAEGARAVAGSEGVCGMKMGADRPRVQVIYVCRVASSFCLLFFTHVYQGIHVSISADLQCCGRFGGSFVSFPFTAWSTERTC